jgi:uncharacterized protein YndB with AHSA1/START domain
VSDLVYERDLPHPPEALFAALADPHAARRWYGAPPGCHRTGIAGAFAPGSQYRMDVMGPGGERFSQVGALVGMVPGRQVTVATRWDGGPLAGAQTQATMAFAPIPGGTRVTVTEGPLPEADRRDGHRAYWAACLDRLGRLLDGAGASCIEDFETEASAYPDPLGLAAYVVLAGMREAGAPAEAIADVEERLYTHLGALDDETAGLLGSVLRKRLAK